MAVSDPSTGRKWLLGLAQDHLLLKHVFHKTPKVLQDGIGVSFFSTKIAHSSALSSFYGMWIYRALSNFWHIISSLPFVPIIFSFWNLKEHICCQHFYFLCLFCMIYFSFLWLSRLAFMGFSLLLKKILSWRELRY